MLSQLGLWILQFVHKNVYVANCILNVHNLEQAAKRCEDDNNKGKEAAYGIKRYF